MLNDLRWPLFISQKLILQTAVGGESPFCEINSQKIFHFMKDVFPDVKFPLLPGSFQLPRVIFLWGVEWRINININIMI